jgi:hypothetical protein
VRPLGKRIVDLISKSNKFLNLLPANAKLPIGIVGLEFGDALRRGDMLKALEGAAWKTIFDVARVNLNVVAKAAVRLDPDCDDELWQWHLEA